MSCAKSGEYCATEYFLAQWLGMIGVACTKNELFCVNYDLSAQDVGIELSKSDNKYEKGCG